MAGVARKTVRRNVTINGLLPGPFDTDRLNGTFAVRAKASGRPAEEIKAEAAAANPAGRFGKSEEFGRACAFLCSAHPALALPGRERHGRPPRLRIEGGHLGGVG